MRRLPPLTAIEAFVQVARLGSMKAAADALSLSSPALSRRIQALEHFVGHTLFERRHKGMHLNPDGERLLMDIVPSIEALGQAMERAAGYSELMRLRLAVPPLFASQRIISKLGDLRSQYPELHIDIDTGPHGIARLDDGLDAAIGVAAAVDPALYSYRLDRDYIVAVGSHDFVSGPKALNSPADLADVTIFLHRDLPNNFNYWSEAAGYPGLKPAAVDLFDSGQLILDAAAQGLGVAFVLESHLKEARDMRLCPLFGTKVESPASYWFACRRSALKRRPVKIFHDWLVSVFDNSAKGEKAAERLAP